MTILDAPPDTVHDLTVTPLTGTVGAVVEGVDLAEGPSPVAVDEIIRAVARHGVLLFRGQHLDPEAQLAFSLQLGPATLGHPNTSSGGDLDPRVLDMQAAKANHWHSDVSFVDRPPHLSLLAQVSTPAFGGDTAWASAVAAYETLPASLQRLADELDVVHANTFDYGTLARTAEERAQLDEVFATNRFETVHPLVRIVAETGARSLFLGGFATRIEGVDGVQSKALIELFQTHITRVEHTVRWHWSDGDVALWDNRVVQHTLVDDLPTYEGRHLRRITTAGELVEGVDGRRSRSILGDSSRWAEFA